MTEDIKIAHLKIVLCDNGSSATYKVEFVIKVIASKETIKFWVKLVKTIPFTKKESIMFYIVITHD
ncbi:hypothetical protein AMD00_14100 [Viridibacillus arvi]|uniref:Uncharacterized protein n=1 Tax=Viridibacillus arvi TaxID=263475 RepID=A0A0M0LF12_9BACL|nr:hypothetical protein AMD00_14100 [Viridibacillus arvi]